VIRANKSWFAVFPKKLNTCLDLAKKHGRTSINFVVYRTESKNESDHHVIPYESVEDVFRDDYLTHSEVNGSVRWNCTLKNHLLHVSHSQREVDVSEYYEAPLNAEEIWTSNGLSEELDETKAYTEGSVIKVSVNRYERDPKARDACIASKGTRCTICNFDFEEIYGARMKGFIHVHHRSPIHLTKSECTVDPIEDLDPVCPNCHAVLHSKRDVLSVDQVKKMIEENGSNKSR